MAHETTRRALIGGAGAAAVIAATPIAAAAIVSTAATGEWDRLVARFATLRQIEADLLKAHCRRSDEWLAAKASLPAKPQPPAARFCRSMTLNELTAATTEPAYVAAWAAYEREKEDWQRLTDARRAEIMGGSDTASDEASRIASEALEAIRNYPARSFRMLEEKANIIGAYYEGAFEQHDTDAIFADLRRLNREALA